MLCTCFVLTIDINDAIHPIIPITIIAYILILVQKYYNIMKGFFSIFSLDRLELLYD